MGLGVVAFVPGDPESYRAARWDRQETKYRGLKPLAGFVPHLHSSGSGVPPPLPSPSGQPLPSCSVPPLRCRDARAAFKPPRLFPLSLPWHRCCLQRKTAAGPPVVVAAAGLLQVRGLPRHPPGQLPSCKCTEWRCTGLSSPGRVSSSGEPLHCTLPRLPSANG